MSNREWEGWDKAMMAPHVLFFTSHRPRRCSELTSGLEPRSPLPAPRVSRHLRIAAVLVAVLGAAGSYLAYDRYQAARLAGSVRGLFAARRYDEARGLIQRWIRERPRSAEAQYYSAWLALVDDQPMEASEPSKRHHGWVSIRACSDR